MLLRLTEYAPALLGALWTALVALAVRAGLNRVWLRAMLQRLVVEAEAAVLEVEQVYVEAIKAARADGVLTAQEKAEARSMALATLRANLGVKGLQRLARVLGIADVDRWLGTRVEAAVRTRTVPTPTAVAAAAAPRPPEPDTPRLGTRSSSR